MRILFVLPSLEIGGAELAVRNMAIALADAGHAVAVLALRANPDRVWIEKAFAPLFRHPGITTIEASATPLHRPVGAWRALGRLRRAIAEFEPEIVHSHCSRADMAVAAIVSHRPFRRVRTAHTSHARPMLGPMVERLVNRLGRFDALIAVSEDVRRNNWGGPACVVIPNPLFDLTPPPARAARHGAAEPLQVAVVGRLEAGKGQRALLDAIRRRYGDGADMPFVLHLYGDGGEAGAIGVAAHSFGDRVLIHGVVLDRDEIYGGKDAVLIPSTTEGLSSVMVEAVAWGVPVLSFDLPGARDVLARWHCGRIVSSHAEMLSQLERGGLPTIDDATRLEVIRQFSIENSVRRHLPLYGGTEGI